MTEGAVLKKLTEAMKDLVTEANFDSIMRRSCVATLKRKFVSPGKIQEMGGDLACGAQGIFTRA